VVSGALKCFHDLNEKIATGHCGSDGAAEYRRSYIQPIVDQSRDTVTQRCTLAPPYDQDYVSSTAPSPAVERRPSRWTVFRSAVAVAATVVGTILPPLLLLLPQRVRTCDSLLLPRDSR
jgi:hypothetical protein